MQKDIKTYLRHCFQVILQQWPGWQWSEAELDELVRRAGKFFVYISTVQRFVGDPHIADPRSQLDILLDAKTPSDISDYDTSPYHFLDNLYLHLVQKAMPLSKRKQMLARYQAVVGTIVTIVNPLSIVSLAHLLALRVENVKGALTYLPSVISLPTSPDEKPQIYHPSCPEFIKDPNRCKDPDLVIVSSDHHRRLAAQCLVHMMTHLKRDICEIRNPSRLHAEAEDLQDKAKQAIPPWLCYTLLPWGTHLDQTPHRDPEIMAYLQLFCTTSLLHWIEALSILGRLEVAIMTIGRVQAWAVSLGP